jgi:hypothetical protein
MTPRSGSKTSNFKRSRFLEQLADWFGKEVLEYLLADRQVKATISYFPHISSRFSPIFL